MVMLEVKNLQAGYDYLQVIWDVSLNITEGEFVVLLGPNGAGKTTVLRTISGILRPRAGEVHFAGRPIGGLSLDQVSNLGLCFIPEDLNLFTGMTVYENLLLGAYRIRDNKKIKELIEYVFHLFPVLEKRRRQLAGTLSGGERKMLAIGRGLMGNPRMLLVDEPSLGLAPLLALSVFEALQQLNKKGNTILLVEQNVGTSLHISDRGYVLEQGRIVLEGPSRNLLENDYVKQVYLGSTKAA
jgi:branched-chain amino acid transport system ATP-binding protein